MPEDKPVGNGWNEYKKLVLSEMDTMEEYRKESRSDSKDMRLLITNVEVRLTNKIDAINVKMNSVDRTVAGLQVKAGIWGLGGGVVAALTALGIWLVQQAMSMPH